MLLDSETEAQIRTMLREELRALLAPPPPTSGRAAYFQVRDSRVLTSASALYCDFRFAPDAPNDLVVRFPDGNVKSWGNYPAGAVVIEVTSADDTYESVLARYHAATAARQAHPLPPLPQLSPAS